MQAKAFQRGPYWVLQLPQWAQAGPELKKLLRMHRFIRDKSKKVPEYFYDPTDSEDALRAERAAHHMKDCYNSGKREYCKPLLIPTI